MSFRVRTNAGAVAREFRDMAEASHDDTVDGLRRASDKAAAQLRVRTPKDTGKLASAWRSLKTKDGARVKNETRYAGFVNDGALIVRAENIVSEAVDAELNRIANDIAEG